MKYTIIIALAVIIFTGCKKDPKDRHVTVHSTQLMKYSQDSSAIEETWEEYMMSEGEKFRRDIKAKTWTIAWGGNPVIQISISVLKDGNGQIIYNEQKAEHHIDVSIP